MHFKVAHDTGVTAVDSFSHAVAFAKVRAQRGEKVSLSRWTGRKWVRVARKVWMEGAK